MNLSARDIYYCPVCGAEVVVIRGGSGEAVLRCCNTAMKRRIPGVKFFSCPVCGAEVMWLRESGESPEFRCCNTAMEPVSGS